MKIDVAGVERSTIASLVDLHGKSILEVGFGSARETSYLTWPDNFILAIDPDPARLKALPGKMPGVGFQCLDILATNWYQEFDLVVFSMALHHIRTREAKLEALAKARRARKPSGEILIIEPPLDGELTRLICEFDQDEIQGISEARDILDDLESGCVAAVKGVKALWEFDDEKELFGFFTTMMQRVRVGITEKEIESALSLLGLAGRAQLIDAIDFYVL
ncbi:MAG: hypothetical protein UT32_C0001G0122 [Parcubacteria group bacterium GW2011_GWC2_39_14]|nr:MAG: hypothetical protein UT32_C0001G0122 [Parcubacteria group bacterium GW2011_GWC2_39_14]KKR55546.1 MAG: hypothetical protein UT91_C0001G0121 [Parcubacteria group bacterium GW2011_GWA2_40_23]